MQHNTTTDATTNMVHPNFCSCTLGKHLILDLNAAAETALPSQDCYTLQDQTDIINFQPALEKLKNIQGTIQNGSIRFTFSICKSCVMSFPHLQHFRYLRCIFIRIFNADCEYNDYYIYTPRHLLRVIKQACGIDVICNENFKAEDLLWNLYVLDPTPITSRGTGSRKI